MKQRLYAPLLCLALFAGAMPLAAYAQMPPPVAMKNAEGLPSLAPMIKQITPAVVNISTRGVIKRRIQGPFMSPLFQQFFGMPQNQTMEQPFESLGSGIIVNAKKGYILTNYHVIRDAKKITVTLYDNRTFPAKIVGDDPATDIAVVQIKAKNLQQISLGNSSDLSVGDYVVAIGNPLGLMHTATFGIVSALGRPNSNGTSDGNGGSQIGKDDDFIQTDAAINPGNSGGPLVNLRGQLVGVNTAIATTNGGNIGIGFAIPVDMAKAVMQQLIQYGKVKRGELGVYAQNLSPALAQQFNLKPGTGGALIAQIIKGSAAEKAGLKQGDVITEVNGQQVNNAAALSSYMAVQRVGTPLTIKIYRNGKPMTIHAKVGKKSGTEEASANGSSSTHQKIGASFADIDKSSPLYGQVRGVVVTQVQRDEAAAEAGLQPGDVITAIDHHPIRDLAQFNQALSAYKGKTVLLNVRRGDNIFFSTITIP
ncbi:MAG: DegQ family serine endoprotease [Gammaproteobacteria bacterium]